MSAAYIPYGLYWSSPFVKWQGALASQHPLRLAAACAKQVLDDHKVDRAMLSSLVLGMTVPSRNSFYGAPWMGAMIGAPHITGPTIMQACATGARCIATAAASVNVGDEEAVLVVTADRTSNGPHIYYPDGNAPGARGESEDWVWDNFNFDPVPQKPMIVAAENVAREGGFTREQQDALALVRYQQYQDALKDNVAFHKRFMLWPLVVKDASGKKTLATVEGDDGIFPTTAEGLAKLKPVVPDGSITFGTQTHPADGNAGLVVTTKERAEALSRDKKVRVRIVSFAQGNAKKGYMAQAVVPAAKRALQKAGWTANDVVIKTHNPFIVNDLYMAREMGLKAESFNNYGSPAIYGHPQAPTGTRATIELIEELVRKGGGRGLFVGCAAGDTAAALCIEVECG